MARSSFRCFALDRTTLRCLSPTGGSPARWLVTASLGLLAASAAADSPRSVDIRLGDDVVPVFQAVHLKVNADEASYSGSVTIDLEVPRPTRAFRFHSEGPELGQWRLERDGRRIEASLGPLGDDVLELTTEEPLEPGDYRLHIEFTNAFDTKATSLYRAQAEGTWYTFTQFEADDAREAFPCWDEPSFKIPYQMTLTVPKDHIAVTNMPVERVTVENGWRTTVFARSPPMPSYLLALATGPFDAVEMPGLGVPAKLYTVKGKAHLTSLAVSVTPPILEALEAYFGGAYPYRKLDFIAVPEFWPGAMENPGAITYADRLLLIDPASATSAQRRAQAGVIAHELAHQWFGNLVTMRWWDDLWLNESFADWMGDKMADRVLPQQGIALSSILSGQRIMDADASDVSVAIRKEIKSTDNLMQDIGLAYAKGKTVLAMFEHWLGAEAFRKGVLDYLQARRWGNATGADLFAALSKVSAKPVAEAMATFTDQPGLPRISIEPLGDGKLRLRQRRFRLHGSDSPDQLWNVPVTLRYRQNDEVRELSLLLEAEEKIVTLGSTSTPDWIHPNAGARGYYRWFLPPAQLEALARQGLDDLGPAERINLVSNVSALLQAGDIDGGTLLAVLTRLAADPEPMVVGAVMDELGLLEVAFVPDAQKAAYGAWLREAFGPTLRRLGYDKAARESETASLLRPRLLSLLSEQAQDEGVTAHFEDLGARFLEAPDSIDPSLAGLSLRALAKKGDTKLFESFIARAEAAKTPQHRGWYLGALSGFEQEALQKRAMRYALEGPVRPNEMFAVLGGFGATEDGQDKLFRFVLDHWQELGEKLPGPYRAFVPRLAGGCSAARLDLAEDFFGQPEHQVPGIERSMTQVRESVKTCVALRERESASVRRFLARYQG